MYFRSKENKNKTKELHKDEICWDVTRIPTQRHIPEGLLVQQHRCENV
jgi:hypothetical protein